MKRSRASIAAGLAAALLTALTPRPARGDGGVVRWRETQGPFSATVFVSPEATRDGLADVSVLLQWRDSGDVVLDADVAVGADPPKGRMMSRAEPLCGLSPAATKARLPDMRDHEELVPATREQASNKLLYAAALNLNAVGDWRLRVYVLRGNDKARFECLLPVTQTPAKAPGLWLSLILPPIVIAAFAANQWLRRQQMGAAQRTSIAPVMAKTKSS
jgi:hypothetical protein